MPRIKRDRSRSTRLRRLRLYPVCAECDRRGLVKATTIIDHVVPLAHGGADTDENCQGLCDLCEAIKTASESASSTGASNHPDWLKRSGAELFIVCGPPFAGKSQYVRREKWAADSVIDLDEIIERLAPGQHRWSGPTDPEIFNRAIRVRNGLLGSLAREKPTRRAWFVINAPSPMERVWWQTKLGGTIICIDPGLTTCVARSLQTPHPAYAEAGVRRWYSERVMPWHPRRQARLPKTGSDENGYPLEG